MKIALCVYVFIILFLVILEYATINNNNKTFCHPGALSVLTAAGLTHSMLTVPLDSSQRPSPVVTDPYHLGLCEFDVYTTAKRP